MDEGESGTGDNTRAGDGDQPVPVEKQVAIIYTVTNGHLDDVKVEHIRQWEREFLDYLEAKQPDILNDIRTKKALHDDLTGRLTRAIGAFKSLFAAD